MTILHRFSSIENGTPTAPHQNDHHTDCQIFVGGFNAQVNDRVLRAHFSKFGPVDRVFIKPGQRYGFVTFKDAASVAMAVDRPEQQICGGRMDVRKYATKAQFVFYLSMYSIKLRERARNVLIIQF